MTWKQKGISLGSCPAGPRHWCWRTPRSWACGSGLWGRSRPRRSGRPWRWAGVLTRWHCLQAESRDVTHTHTHTHTHYIHESRTSKAKGWPVKLLKKCKKEIPFFFPFFFSVAFLKFQGCYGHPWNFKIDVHTMFCTVMKKKGTNLPSVPPNLSGCFWGSNFMFLAQSESRILCVRYAPSRVFYRQ